MATQRQLQVRLEQAHDRLESLRAISVAGRIETGEYQALLEEFADLTELRASDPFRDPQTAARGSVHVASLVHAVQSTLAKAESEPNGRKPLEFLSVSPGGQQQTGPFVAVEFALNLRGEFLAVPPFLDLLTKIGRQRNLAISIGALQLVTTGFATVTGKPELAITLPVRAYFRD